MFIEKEFIRITKEITDQIRDKLLFKGSGITFVEVEIRLADSCLKFEMRHAGINEPDES